MNLYGFQTFSKKYFKGFSWKFITKYQSIHRYIKEHKISINKFLISKFRYSTYAVSKILSYNPLDDIEFSTIREQGFLVYLPINNEIKLNLLEKHVT